jgi:hypothetical protein
MTNRRNDRSMRIPSGDLERQAIGGAPAIAIRFRRRTPYKQQDDSLVQYESDGHRYDENVFEPIVSGLVELIKGFKAFDRS